MICPCGGQVRTVTRTLKTREALLEWFPKATDQALPAMIMVSTCRACKRLDKRLSSDESRPDCDRHRKGKQCGQLTRATGKG